MIDTHAHILPGLDDGAETMEQTKRMLEKAVAEQLTGIIATPHAFHPNFNTNLAALKKQLELVNSWIAQEQLPLTIYSGQECRLSDKLPERLVAGEALTMAGSRYVLLELPSSGIPAYTVPIIQQLITRNYVPIIAHAERNQGIIEKPERLKKLLLHGALAQVTAGSVAGSFGKAIQRTAMSLIDANLIHVYGSDVHSLDKRPFLFNEGLDYLEKKNQHDMVDIFLENNERILLDDHLHVLEPEDIRKGKWWNIFA
ncbi:CpsB/CapC family capsule biosynthesis tyrosine phosphatase [Planococcus sp. ISL-110]|uniref:tyrosine-protein phosphatase n=1 Tax=Planococcus sp. ISL-110 TaxID=2819167 RepID=UPI001BEBFF49|nr:CpsB/CapC family capsule biosynthesis tyrosine phosphatase [Planococcus sp. ISL-110]MBT2572013.1 capsular biosynthesis protein [Planococcus sp. ISL-110]